MMDVQCIDILIEGHVIDGAIGHFDLSKRFQELGIKSSVLGLSGEPDLPGHFERVDNASIQSQEWWKARKVHAVLAYGLCLSEATARAIRDAGVRLVVELDTSGDISPRESPLAARARMADARHALVHAIRVHSYWLKQIWWEWRDIEEKLFKVLRWADHISIPGVEAKGNLDELFRLRGREDLRCKVTVVPFAVREDFTQQADLPLKEKRIVIASRLDSQQKDPVLMVEVLSRFLDRNSEYSISIFSRGECSLAKKLAMRNTSRIEFQIDASRDVVRNALLRSQIILYTSRHETVPVGALEALCSGCTLVGPPLPGLRELAENGRFGMIASHRTAASLVAALESECQRWAQSMDSVENALYWRSRNSLTNVAQQWLELLMGANSVSITEQQPAA